MRCQQLIYFNLIFFLGGLFKVYCDRRDSQAADYVLDVNAEFGIGHLQRSIHPDTVSLD